MGQTVLHHLSWQGSKVGRRKSNNNVWDKNWGLVWSEWRKQVKAKKNYNKNLNYNKSAKWRLISQDTKTWHSNFDRPPWLALFNAVLNYPSKLSWHRLECRQTSKTDGCVDFVFCFRGCSKASLPSDSLFLLLSVRLQSTVGSTFPGGLEARSRTLQKHLFLRLLSLPHATPAPTVLPLSRRTSQGGRKRGEYRLPLMTEAFFWTRNWTWLLLFTCDGCQYIWGGNCG